MGRAWDILRKVKRKDLAGILETLLRNRRIKTKKDKKDFFDPPHPSKISLSHLGIDKTELRKTASRIKKAKETGEKVIVYGDYDADGICGTAILWETLYSVGINTLPHIPERFTEGYGLNVESIKKLKVEDPTIGLIVTVDHGIVAHKKIEEVKDLGIDIIITDHHQPENGKPPALAVIHTTKIGGAAVAWLLACEFGAPDLGLASIGTMADQLPLVGHSRSFAKYGLEVLRTTRRVGLLALFEETGIKQETIGPYEVNFIIAPRLNAMGRLEHAIDSLRLLCTKDSERARTLAQKLGEVNQRRQRVLEETVFAAKQTVGNDVLIFVADKAYHEGVIGLAAAHLVEEFHRPAIVVSVGDEFSKASARSIPGFNIVEHIKSFSEFLIEGGGHPMAAGFTIKTSNLEVFAEKVKRAAEVKLTPKTLSPKLRIDCKLEFNQLNLELTEAIQSFEPTGIGNPEPTFLTEQVFVQDARLVGSQNQHLKLWLVESQTTSHKLRAIEAIWFGMGSVYPTLFPDKAMDIVYTLMLDEWNGQKSLKLKIKDLKEHGRTKS